MYQVKELTLNYEVKLELIKTIMDADKLLIVADVDKADMIIVGVHPYKTVDLPQAQAIAEVLNR